MQTTIPTCRKAIHLPCPFCGEQEVNIAVHLSMLDDDTADCFTCSECNAEFSIETVRAIVKKWSRLLTWLDTAPDVDAE